MRLLKRDADGNVTITKDLDDEHLPFYAILSHTWGSDEDEVTFEDVSRGSGRHKQGYEKIRFCAQQTQFDGLEYFWIDTCCINKASNTELSEAIVSMYGWYSRAVVCYVYLSDVWPQLEAGGTTQAWHKELTAAFRSSRWFTRGWTLQELLAPPKVRFFNRYGQRIGTLQSCKNIVSEITKIPVEAFDVQIIKNFSVEIKMSWQTGRQTRKPEDLVYSLLGILDISMPVLYGEGEDKARKRLQRELGLSSTLPRQDELDQSLELHAAPSRSTAEPFRPWENMNYGPDAFGARPNTNREMTLSRQGEQDQSLELQPFSSRSTAEPFRPWENMNHGPDAFGARPNTNREMTLSRQGEQDQSLELPSFSPRSTAEPFRPWPNMNHGPDAFGARPNTNREMFFLAPNSDQHATPEYSYIDTGSLGQFFEEVYEGMPARGLDIARRFDRYLASAVPRPSASSREPRTHD